MRRRVTEEAGSGRDGADPDGGVAKGGGARDAMGSVVARGGGEADNPQV